VDCIDMLPVIQGIVQWHWPSPASNIDLIATSKIPRREDAA
jgi:hypothetical protein